MATALDKQALANWEAFRQSIIRATPIPVETFAEKQKRIKFLLDNPEEFNKFYFPNFYLCEPAKFQIKSSKRVLNNPEWYEVRAWARDLAKSTRTMFDVIYLVVSGKKKNIILVSNSEDNAERLITPYRLILESNQRLINDFGIQKGMNMWTSTEFTTVKGASFRALGAGQSPRGTRSEAIRPDCILIDDIDTDEECRNPERITNKWEWIESALIPTRATSIPLLIIFCGNIIAEYCCITEAIKKADKVDIVNIRTNGVSSWIERNSEEQIDRVLSKMSFSSAQREYFNNPITEGKVFKELSFGKIPPLHKFKYLVAYGDPSPSNKEIAKNSFKTIVLVGALSNKFYVVKCFLEQTLNSRFIDWYYDMRSFVGDKTVIYNYIENNTLQDPFYEQVFKPMFFQKQKETGHLISIIPDDRKKPDKFTRIEGTLEPINRMGSLIFNEDEKTNPHMQRLIDQFKAVSPQNKHLIDGPDAVEGAVFVLNTKNVSVTNISLGNRYALNQRSNKRM